MNLPVPTRPPYDPNMALSRASLPQQKRRTRLVLPAFFLAFAALGSGLGLAQVPIPSFPRAAIAPARPSRADDAPVPIDLSDVKTPTAFPRLNPETSTGRAWLLAEGPEPKPNDGRRYVTFTFDDGPFVETTPAILRVLSQRKVHATFFVVGQYLEGQSRRAARTRQILRDIDAAGHLVGNHTKDHKLLTAIPRSEAVLQIDENSELLERTLGKKPALFRPPFGELDTYTRGVVHDRRLELVLWSIEAADMKNDDPVSMARNLRNQIEFNGGGIVLLHDIRPTTLPTLKRVLEFLHQKRWRPETPEKVGYQVVDLPTYFSLTEASPRPHANREALENARHDAFRKKHPEGRAPEAPAEDDGESESDQATDEPSERIVL